MRPRVGLRPVHRHRPHAPSPGHSSTRRRRESGRGRACCGARGRRSPRPAVQHGVGAVSRLPRGPCLPLAAASAAANRSGFLGRQRGSRVLREPLLGLPPVTTEAWPEAPQARAPETEKRGWFSPRVCRPLPGAASPEAPRGVRSDVSPEPKPRARIGLRPAPQGPSRLVAQSPSAPVSAVREPGRTSEGSHGGPRVAGTGEAGRPPRGPARCAARWGRSGPPGRTPAAWPCPARRSQRRGRRARARAPASGRLQLPASPVAPEAPLTSSPSIGALF